MSDVCRIPVLDLLIDPNIDALALPGMVYDVSADRMFWAIMPTLLEIVLRPRHRAKSAMVCHPLWKDDGSMIDDQTLASEFRHLASLGMRVEDRQMRRKGVSLAQSRLLEVIQHTARARWSDIAAALGYSPRTITEALDVLERDGLIVRVPDPADRRARILTVTKKAARALAAAQGARDQVRGVIFGVLSDAERRKLLNMLRRIRAAAQSIDTEPALNLPG